MTEREYRRNRKQMELELDSAESVLARVQGKLAALDLLWKEHFSKGCGSQSSAEAINTSEKVVVVNGQAQLMIDEAALGISGEFGVKEIEAAIHSKYPDKTVNRTTISGRLSKLAEDGRIELVERGMGRRPGKFRGKAA